jgi:Leucine-rich repeat (LRR) protein
MLYWCVVGDQTSNDPQFPKEIFELTNLQYLNVQYQAFRHIPEEISKLVNLEEVNFSYNPYLVSLPSALGLRPLKR